MGDAGPSSSSRQRWAPCSSVLHGFRKAGTPPGVRKEEHCSGTSYSVAEGQKVGMTKINDIVGDGVLQYFLSLLIFIFPTFPHLLSILVVAWDYGVSVCILFQ